EDLAYLAGVVAADGTYGDVEHQVKIPLYGQKTQFVDQVTNASWRVLRAHDDFVLAGNSTSEPVFSGPSGGGDGRQTLTSTPLGRALAQQGFTRESKLSVPEFVKRAERRAQRAFLSGLFQMDGTITGSVSAGSCSIELG